MACANTNKVVHANTTMKKNSCTFSYLLRNMYFYNNTECFLIIYCTAIIINLWHRKINLLDFFHIYYIITMENTRERCFNFFSKFIYQTILTIGAKNHLSLLLLFLSLLAIIFHHHHLLNNGLNKANFIFRLSYAEKF